MEPTAFTGAPLDRAADERRRDPEWLAAQRHHPAARAVLAGSGGLHLTDGGSPRVALLPLSEAGGDGALLLGIDAEGPVFAVDEDLAQAPAGRVPPMVGAGGMRGEPPARTASAQRGTRVVGLREAAGALPRTEGGLAAYATALLNWHRRHRFCANCGSPSAIAEGGLVRTCPACGAEHHPRTDPVVIMLVEDGDRVLLGRQPIWPTGRYSALAGFVEPGESLEEAVAREVAEETQVTVGPPRYLASQPWPFPASLMLGFVAPWVSGEPTVADSELEDARWFTRAEVARAAREDEDDWTDASSPDVLRLPPRLAIARRLVDIWLDA
jgi:NAD+ diphosphatase